MINPHHIIQAVERAQQALNIAQEKPSPKGSGGGSSSVEPPMPLPAGVISAKRELRDVLLLWVDLVADGMGIVEDCDPTERDMLEWLAGNERATFLVAQDVAGDFLDELTTITKSLENPYLPRAGKKYWGNHDGQAIYIRDGQREVTLDNGDTIPVMEIRDTAANRLLNHEGPAEQIALIINEYFGHHITAKHIAKAQANDKRKKEGTKLEPIRTEGRNHIYTVYDVLKRLCQK